jgi:hypothetical protein
MTQILRDYIPYSRKVVFPRVAKSIKKTPCVNAEDANACMRCRLLSRNRMSNREKVAIARRRQMPSIQHWAESKLEVVFGSHIAAAYGMAYSW